MENMIIPQNLHACGQIRLEKRISLTACIITEER